MKKQRAGIRELQDLTPEQVLQYYKNAKKTFLQSAGRLQAETNKQRAQVYEDELKRRGIDTPSYPQVMQDGEFNGFGSV